MQLLESQRRFYEVIDRSDVDAVARLLLPGFVAIDPAGALRDRGAFLTDLRATPPAAQSKLRRDWSQVRTHVQGDEGVFVGRSTWRVADSGSDGSPLQPIRSLLVTQHWRWNDGQWRLQSQQMVAVAPPPQIVRFASGPLTLQAMVFRPQGKGPFPAVVYAHGNEPDPSDLFETVGPPLAARGFLVFAPHRRGSGLSGDQAENLLRRLTQIEREQGAGARARVALEQLQGPQLADMEAAVQAARQRPDVDPSRIYMIGNSFGGVLVMLAAERGLGLAGAVNFAGAAINWERSEAFREVMSRAARNARIPLYLAQAENDFSTAPTRSLGAILCEAGKTSHAKVYGPFGVTAGDGHSLGVDGVDRWAEDVFGFLANPTKDPACR